jgi:hypothetical protein
MYSKLHRNSSVNGVFSIDMATSLVRFLTTSLHEYQPLSYPGYLLLQNLDTSQEQLLLLYQHNEQPP